MWPTCIVTTVEGTLGILVAGGKFILSAKLN